MKSLNQWFARQPIWIKLILSLIILLVLIPSMCLGWFTLLNLSEPCTAYFTKSQSLSSEPNSQVFVSLEQVPRSTHASVIARSRDGWVQVTVDDQTGWVYAHP